MSSAILELILKGKNETAGAFSSASAGLGHLGKEAKGVTGEMEHLAGKGGLGAVGGALGSLGGIGGGPIGIAIGGLTALGAVGLAAMDTYEKIEVQTKALDIALGTHGLALQAEHDMIEGNRGRWEALGYTMMDVRPAFTKLTEAGLSQAQQLEAMGPIMDLARAKHIDLETATGLYTKGLVGNVKALAEYGIKLPAATIATKEHAAAVKEVDKDTTALALAQEKLTIIQDGLAGKTKLTAAEQTKLHAAEDKVTAATDKLNGTQEHLNNVQSQGVDNAKRLKDINDALNKTVGGQAGAISATASAQAELNDRWQLFTMTIGPGLVDLQARFLNGLLKVIDALGSVLDLLGKGIDSLLGDMGAANAAAYAGRKAAWGGLVGIGHASGGWVGLHGPEIGLLGERGPEYVVPNHRLGGMGGGTPITNHFTVQLPPAPWDSNGSMAQDMASRLIYAFKKECQRQGITLAP